MIEFKPVRLEDRAVIERYTMRSGICNCDLAFANMYCWQQVYHSAWAEIDGFLVIRFRIDGGEKIGYMQPVGEGDFAPLIPTLRADAHAHGQRLRIIGLTDEGREMIRRMHIGLFAFESDRALEDYVYNADDLRNLPGRRYQPKRNHINRFLAEYPDYRYEELTHDRFDECMALEREWRRAHEGHTSELCAEQRAMQRGFEHFGELGMQGGCIYVGDRLVAFTYGSAVNDHTFDTHVEKADTEYDGAFTIINKLFAQHLDPRFTLINREEDLGIEGLRQAKLSYHPAFLQHKFTAIHLHPDEIACKELWQAAFGDDEQFVDSFLMRYYSHHRMLTAECDGRTAAMLHLLPFETPLGRTTYIYGVATDPACRHRGWPRSSCGGDGAALRNRASDAALPSSQLPARRGCATSTAASASRASSRRRSVRRTASTSARAMRRPTGRWSGGATPPPRCPMSLRPPTAADRAAAGTTKRPEPRLRALLYSTAPPSGRRIYHPCGSTKAAYRLSSAYRPTRATLPAAEEALDRVLHQAADRHGADTARHGRDDRRLRLDGLEIHVAAQFARLGIAVHTHVDDDRPLGDHIRRNKLRAADGHDQNLRPARHLPEVARPAVRHRHRGVLVQQQFRNGQPHDIAAPDHHGSLAGDLHARGLQHLDDPLSACRAACRAASATTPPH